jgi:hypothetical protein
MTGGQTHLYVHSTLHYKIEPEGADRITLAGAPEAEGGAESYILTRGARRILEVLTNRDQSGRGEFLWLGDSAGCGKTHFLNYYRDSLRASVSKSEGRELLLSLDCSTRGAPDRLEHKILAALTARMAAGRGSAASMGHRIAAPAAFEATLNDASRAGFGSITALIDLGRNPAPAFATELVRIARASHRPRLTIVAAGLGAAPPEALIAEVGPSDFSELLVVAVGRARRLEPRWTENAYLYRGFDVAPFVPEQIFPFHPRTLLALIVLEEPVTIATVAG